MGKSGGVMLPASGWRVVFLLAFAIAALARLIGVFLKFVFFFIEFDDFTLQGAKGQRAKLNLDYAVWLPRFACPF